ncbi:MAG: pilus assembly protein PilM [Candidatus Roizmanbacteria bacterium]|nr:pilus assembly protein PilM [Candidatus Roizmanbacteria bacterium]
MFTILVSLVHMAETSFGIDIGEKFTRVSDASLKNKKIDLTSLGEELSVVNYFNDDLEKTMELQAEIMAKMAKDLKISKKNVHVVIPDSYCYAQVMEFSKLNQKELLSAVRYQADQFIPLPIDEVVFDLEVVKENALTKKNTILVIASPKKLVERVEKTVELAGFIPESLESELSAITRYFSDLSTYAEAQPSSYLVINFGFATTSIYLVTMPQGVLLELRIVKTGFDLFIKELKFNLELQDNKAMELLESVGFEKNGTYDLATFAGPLLRDLVSEMSKFVVIAKDKHQLPVKKVYLCNFDSRLHALDKKLTELLKLPVESILMRDVLVNNPISQSFSPKMSSFVASISANIR